MNTIKETIENTLIIKNSRFITIIYNINDINDVDKYLKLVKDKYKDATHYCYAYILPNNIKCSDDGEPGGTAGKPILDVLTKHNLNFVLAIVVRYFGGIKLGAGGLIRAYSKCISSCLNNTKLTKLIPGKNIDIYFTYKDINDIDLLLTNCHINNKNYQDMISYNVNIPNDLLPIIENKYQVKVNNNIYIKSDM